MKLIAFHGYEPACPALARYSQALGQPEQASLPGNIGWWALGIGIGFIALGMATTKKGRRW